MEKAGKGGVTLFNTDSKIRVEGSSEGKIMGVGTSGVWGSLKPPGREYLT